MNVIICETITEINLVVQKDKGESEAKQVGKQSHALAD
jgi:hypothetical protein